MKHKLNKALLLGTLSMAQVVGVGVGVHSGIIQTYAEQKSKDITSQQFLDYINQLKQKYPDFKFEENTVVYNSTQEAQQAEQTQKQQIEQSIKQYEDAKKQQKEEHGRAVDKYQQDLTHYNQEKQTWENKKAELESKKA